MDHTPIIGWLIDGLRYLRDLAEEYNGTAAIKLIAGLSGFNLMMRRYVDEHAPMTQDQANRLEELGAKLIERLTQVQEQLDERSIAQLEELQRVIVLAKERCQK